MEQRLDRLRIMSVHASGALGDYHPQIGGVTVDRFNCTTVAGDNDFLSTDRDVIIHAVFCGKGAVCILSMTEGAAVGGDKVLEIRSTVATGAQLSTPFALEGGFNINKSATGNSAIIVFEVIGKRGA